MRAVSCAQAEERAAALWGCRAASCLAYRERDVRGLASPHLSAYAAPHPWDQSGEAAEARQPGWTSITGAVRPDLQPEHFVDAREHVSSRTTPNHATEKVYRPWFPIGTSR